MILEINQNLMAIIRISLCSIIILALTIIKNVHIIQLNSYNLDQQIIWYKKNINKFLLNLILLVSIIFYYKFNLIIFLILIVISLLILLIENLPRKQKKKLVYTSRIKRLILICSLLLLVFFIPAFITFKYKDTFYILLSVALSPFIIFLAYLIALPIENAFRKHFMNEAKTVINDYSNVSVVGITGSYGKTSVKYFLHYLLSAKYNVCMTPESFNTSMGATLTVKNNLRSFDDYFICEMGARRVGDIKEICDIVFPSSAILTDVGNMHLDTFKNIENVRKCKFELVDSACKNISDKKNSNIILLNGDNEHIINTVLQYKSENRFLNKSVYTYGFNTNCDFAISNIRYGAFGSEFTIKSNNEEFNFSTKLLGKHNIANLTAAIAFAYLSGIDKESLIREVGKIEAVDHRLKLKKYNENNIVIDDAYNSNPIGAKSSADVLASFDGYTKVMITPGMVELSTKQYDENRDFALYASDKIDYAFVVGKTNKDALMAGFSQKLSSEHLIHFDKVEEAIFYALNQLEGKKVILLENDLSDNY